MKKTILLILFFGLVLAGLAMSASVDCLSSCELVGNHYECTGTLSCDSFEAGDKGVWIHDATVSRGGSTGGTNTDGEDVIMTISSSSKVIVEDSSFSSGGGAGGSAVDISSAPDGGDATLTIEAESLIWNNSDFSATGGDGSKGDTDTCPVSENDDDPSFSSYGGHGGDVGFDVDVTNDLYINNIALDLDGGSGDNAEVCADGACYKDDEENYISSRIQSDADADGGDGGDITFSLEATNLEIYNVTYYAQGGDTGYSDRDVYAEICEVGQTAKARAEATAGAPGDVDFSINAENTIIRDFYYVPSTYDAKESEALTMIESGGDNSVTAGEDGRSIPTFNFEINSTSFNINHFNITFVGSRGGRADAFAGCVADCDRDYGKADGGNGGSMSLNIYSENGTWNNSKFYLISGKGNEGKSANVDPGTYDWGQPGTTNGYHDTGNAGSIGLISQGTNFVNSMFDLYGIDNDQEVNPEDAAMNGHGGSAILDFVNRKSICSNSTFYLEGGDGAEGDDEIWKTSGRGGDAYTRIFSDLETNKCNMTFKGDKPISFGPSYTRSGNAKIEGWGNLKSYDSTFFFKGGDKTDAGDGGNSSFELNSLELWNNSVLDFNPGTYGDCPSTFLDKMIIEDSNITCEVDSSTRISYINGIGISEVSLRNNTYISLEGTPGTLNFNYTNDTQKFLIWNADFNETSIYWNNDTCKFTNRTPYINSTVTFNESCTDDGWDNYYTDLESIAQVWYDDESNEEPLSYSFTDYSCRVNVSFPEDILGNIKANIIWLKNDVVQPYSQTEIDLNSSEMFETSGNGVLPATEVSLDDELSCRVELYSDFSRYHFKNSTVEPTYPYNLKVYIGESDTSVFNHSGVFNVSNYTSLDYGDFNGHLQRYCDSSLDDCDVPITFISDSEGVINLSSLSVFYGTDDTSERKVNVPISFESSTAGILNVTDPYLKLMSDDDKVKMTVTDNETGTVLDKLWPTIKNSIFNIGIIPNTDYWNVYPLWPTQDNVEPWGQDDDTAFWNITSEVNHSFDLFVRFSENNWLDCTDTKITQTYDTNIGKSITDNLTNITTYTEANQSKQYYTFTDFDCTVSKMKYWFPNLDFKSRCTDCVNTSDFWVE